MQNESTFSNQHYTDPHSARLGKLSNFACCFGALSSGILWIWKKYQIPENLRSMKLFLDPWNSTYRRFELACKVNQHFGLGVTRSSQRLAGRSKFTLHASLEHFIMEYCESEKSARFLRILRLWHFFQILRIPLLSALNGHAKCLNFFLLGAECGWGGTVLGWFAQHYIYDCRKTTGKTV
jgi:hypothetical protein